MTLIIAMLLGALVYTIALYGALYILKAILGIFLEL